MVKNLPAVRETWVPSLGGEDPLEKGTATHSSILVWRIPWTEGYSRQGRKGSDTTERLNNNKLGTGVKEFHCWGSSIGENSP